MTNQTYDQYIAIDWAMSKIAIAKMTKDSNEVTVKEMSADIKEIQNHLYFLKGQTKTLTIEETSAAQWLYTELRGYVDELVVCDPYRNKLLSEGAKNDSIDAEKLVRLLKAGLLKPTFHCSGEFIYLRKLTSAYWDLIKRGVRLKNQRFALFQADGRSHKGESLEHPMSSFVPKGLDEAIAHYELDRKRYEKEFEKLSRKHKLIQIARSVPGIGPVSYVKIVAQVIEPRRFSTKGHFLSYCGLVKLEKVSGGKGYDWRRSRYCSTLKSVFKTAALAVIRADFENPLRLYYEQLLKSGKMAEFQARHAVARRIAVITLGVLKYGKPFGGERYRELAMEEDGTESM